MKINYNFKNQILLFFVLIIVSCSKNDAKSTVDEGSTISITCKVNGNLWRSNNGSGAINDINGNSNAYMLVGGSKEGGDQSATQLNIKLKGVNVSNGKNTIIKGGFNGGEFIGLNYNDKDYVTNKGTTNTEIGAISIISVGANVTGAFNGVLYADNGEIITITEGTFSVPLTHF